MKNAIVWGAMVSMVVATAAGCREKKHTVRYENEPEVIYVQEPPPPLIVENCPPCPAQNYVWINGYWCWSGKKYVWKKGRWVPPRHHGEYWIEPRYEKHRHGYRYVPGYWDKKPPKHHAKPPKHHDEPKNPKKHHDKPPKPKHHDKHDKHHKKDRRRG
jgi:hypothetical protein